MKSQTKNFPEARFAAVPSSANNTAAHWKTRRGMIVPPGTFEASLEDIRRQVCDKRRKPIPAGKFQVKIRSVIIPPGTF